MALAQASPEQIFTALCYFNIFKPGSSEFKVKSDRVWKDASAYLNNKPKAVTLNSYVRCNRYNLLNRLKEHNGLIVEPILVLFYISLY